MFRAIGKFFRTLGYLLTGRIDKISSVWQSNPAVIGATYDKVVNEKRQRLNTYKDAVGSMIAQQEKKKITLTGITEETSKLEKLRQGALAKGKQVAAKYASPEEAKSDPEYLKCLTAYRDFSSTLEEKSKRVLELEHDIENFSATIAEHKTSIESLMRELEKIKSEKHETIADIISAKEEKQIADLFSGISEDKTGQELQELRDVRTKAKADAKMSRELAGMETKRSEDEFLKYATENTHDNEFDQLIGLTKKESPATTAPVETKLSEN